MEISDLIAGLQGLPPLDLAAAALLAQLDEPDDEELARRQPEIEKAMAELETHVRHAQEIVRRCLRLQPVPTHTPPAGF